MAGWIKMPLGTKVALGPGHVVLDGDPAPPWKGAQQPALFSPCLLWPNGRPSQQLLSSCYICEQHGDVCRRAKCRHGHIVSAIVAAASDLGGLTDERTKSMWRRFAPSLVTAV